MCSVLFPMLFININKVNKNYYRLYKWILEIEKSMKKYQSRISYLLLGIILIVLISPLIFMPPNIMGVVITLIVIAFTLHLFSNTYYTIGGKELTVKSGFFIYKKIDVTSIRKISETNSLLSAPALSFDRLEIWYSKYGSIMISPKDKSNFIDDILKINPEIEIVFNSTKK